MIGSKEKSIENNFVNFKIQFKSLADRAKGTGKGLQKFICFEIFPFNDKKLKKYGYWNC